MPRRSRIRGVQHQRIYRIDPNCDYGSLTSLVSRADQTIDTEQIAEQWDRMGQLYASLKTGHVTVSVALKRLVGFSAKNRFYRANRDLGRIFKTEFLLSYLSEPRLRARMRRGLLKVEQLHALARDIYYGRRGRINARELHEQMNSCSCLTLLLACVFYWQAKEISRVLKMGIPEGEDINFSLLELSAPSNGKTSFFTAGMCSTRTTFAKTDLLNSPQWPKKPGVSRIASHSKTSILGHSGASVLRSYLEFYQSFIFARPTGLRVQQVSARPCFKTFPKKLTGRAVDAGVSAPVSSRPGLRFT